MGGSSLAPLVLATSFEASGLAVLDSTDPAAVRAAADAAESARTLFVVTSKSGTTVETLAFYRFFAERADSRQFVAITDPGSPLEELARDRRFRACFPHPPDVGGRYAALTVVGMLPAALARIDGPTLLARAAAVDERGARERGVRLAAAAASGRDKLVVAPPPPVRTLALWIEQLVAESTGKAGRGILPVVADAGGSRPRDAALADDFSADPLDLGAEFHRWMHATRAACEMLGVDPFDQPDVEEAKRLARTELHAPSRQERLAGLLTLDELRRSLRPGDYVAALAFLPPRRDVEARLERLRQRWNAATGCVTTAAFGPRYLHSTGQLHKGGPNTGAFVVLTADTPDDIEIPGMGTTFGALEHAQARGDIRALVGRGRRVSHVHLPDPGALDDLHPGSA